MEPFQYAITILIARDEILFAVVVGLKVKKPSAGVFRECSMAARPRTLFFSPFLN
jgi:hypothetical protein